MKIRLNISRYRYQSGITLIECMCYIMVFLILSSVAMGSFYLCWNHSEALIAASDDTSAALRAGERWRADVRAASGAITVQPTASGQVVKIPEGDKEIDYTFDSKEVRRQIASENISQLLLPRVLSSEMVADPRGSVMAWRWELQVKELRKEMHTKLMFTFEAVSKTP